MKSNYDESIVGFGKLTVVILFCMYSLYTIVTLHELLYTF